MHRFIVRKLFTILVFVFELNDPIFKHNVYRGHDAKVNKS
jgi:hypothetical protein